MASFPDFQNPVSAQENSDFVLYSSTHDSYPDFLPTSSHPYTSNQYINSTGASFDPYSIFPQTSQSQDFGFGSTSTALQSKSNYHPQTPAESPTNSAKNSFDVQPPNLSSTSDSGASVQSTSSSAMGSPSLNPHYAQEGWNTLGQGLGLAPGIVQHDHLGQEPFTTSGFEYEPLLVHEKIPGCVGESPSISSSHHPVQPPSQSFSSSRHPISSDVFPSGQRPVVQRATSLDTSIAGHYPPQSGSQQRTPTSAGPHSAQEARYGQQFGSHISHLAAPGASGFKSPITPASATRSRGLSPPNRDRRGSHFQHSLPPVNQMGSMSSPVVQQPPGPTAGPANQASPTSQAAASPFFSQSNPSLIQPYAPPASFSNMPYPDYTSTSISPAIRFDHPPSPAPSDSSIRSPQRSGSRQFKTGSQSPYLRTVSYQPYQQYPNSRRPSAASIHSRSSHGTHRSDSIDEEGKEKGLCPIPECGRVFKDLKAHMLTHQTERPEKCPIPTCEYHQKGFARKYDKNRHTLTHYKGTMVCGFCPGTGSAAEKSFNRADVFKRHLTSVHGVEQTPPNSRKKSPTVNKKSYNSSHNTAGTCSTCGVTFANAQEFYEHLDDCVLRVVQQTDPSEAINQRILTSVADDKDVKETMGRHMLSTSVDYSAGTYDEAEDDDDDESEKEDVNDDTYGARASSRSGKGGIRSNKKSSSVTKTTNNNQTGGGAGARRGAGLTYSKGGVGLSAMTGSGRKKRKHYPTSWGCSTDKMKMKKRVLCVYDGSRRLWKDDMMLDSEFEVRLPLPGDNGNAYVTDLDVQTLMRADALHGATDEEKGPWVRDNVSDVDLEQLMA
ncbi:MAG: hypothetical protein M1820_004945 [Bogoriella megaspora]|nr:MAG: hypothetical protein M1820_004945 [Bogoriella megaspora]